MTRRTVIFPSQPVFWRKSMFIRSQVARATVSTYLLNTSEVRGWSVCVCVCVEREREREGGRREREREGGERERESRTNLLPPSAISNTGQLRVLTNGHERNTIVRNVGFSRAHLPKEARPCSRSHEPRLPHRVVEWLHRCTQRLWGKG